MTRSPDDPTVRDTDPLWRRIHPDYYIRDERGGMRLSSAAFDNSSDGTGMSVTLGREARDAGVTPKIALTRFSRFGLASLMADVCRRHRQAIERDPTEEDPHHALVNGEKPKSVRRSLASNATLLVKPKPKA